LSERLIGKTPAKMCGYASIRGIHLHRGATLQSLIQTAHELLILARIRNEDFLWAWRLFIAGRYWHRMML
jgi:hypothetical protein